MKMGRWIVISGVDSEAGVEALAINLARELAIRHSVLLWEICPASERSAKTPADVLPYRDSFSPAMTQNFLRDRQAGFCRLQGFPVESPETLFSLMKSAFDFVLVNAQPL